MANPTPTNPTTTTTMAAQNGPPYYPYQPTSVLCGITIMFGLWIILGAIGWSEWPTSSTNNLTFGEVFILTATPPFYFVMTAITMSDYDKHPSPPARSGAIFILGALSFSVIMAWCVLTGSFANGFQLYFKVLGATFVGCGFEVFTGILTRYLQWLEKVNELRPGTEQRASGRDE